MCNKIELEAGSVAKQSCEAVRTSWTKELELGREGEGIACAVDSSDSAGPVPYAPYSIQIQIVIETYTPHANRFLLSSRSFFLLEELKQ